MKPIKSDAVSKAVAGILEQVAQEEGCTVAELIEAGVRKLKDSPGASVTAIMTKAQTTIDGNSGDVTVSRSGVFKSFGKGFRGYVMRGPQHVSVGAQTVVGQLPQGHPEAGKWAVQVSIFPFDTKILANEMADGRITPLIESLLGGKAVSIS